MLGGQGCWPRDPTLGSENSEQGGGLTGLTLPSARGARTLTDSRGRAQGGLGSRCLACRLGATLPWSLWVAVRLAFPLHTHALMFLTACLSSRYRKKTSMAQRSRKAVPEEALSLSLDRFRAASGCRSLRSSWAGQRSLPGLLGLWARGRGHAPACPGAESVGGSAGVWGAPGAPAPSA